MLGSRPLTKKRSCPEIHENGKKDTGWVGTVSTQFKNSILHRARTNNFTICMEIQKTSNSQSDLEKEDLQVSKVILKNPSS